MAYEGEKWEGAGCGHGMDQLSGLEGWTNRIPPLSTVFLEKGTRYVKHSSEKNSSCNPIFDRKRKELEHSNRELKEKGEMMDNHLHESG